MTSVRSSDALDFDTAWAEVLRQYEPAVRVTSALLKLTGLGEHAVHIELLAEAINQPVPDTLNLLTQWTTARVDDREVRLNLTTAGPAAHYRLSVDTRTLDADGCAVDIFWMALVSGKRIHAESVCPATGTPIRVEVDSHQVELVEPGTSVVAVMNPRAPELRSITGAEQANLAICPQQPIFASHVAAADWCGGHPGGRLFAPSEFLDWWREHLRRMEIV